MMSSIGQAGTRSTGDNMGYKRILCAAFAVMMLAVFIPNRVFADASADSYVDRFINGGGVELGLYPESDQEAIDPMDIEGRYKIKKPMIKTRIIAMRCMQSTYIMTEITSI